MRRRVAEGYGRIATRQISCCESTEPPRAVVPQDDDAADPPEQPAHATVNSYGCGSPVVVGDMQPNDVVLDLGCGTGCDLLLAAEKVGPSGRVIGVDMSDTMLARARANVGAAGLDNIDLRRGIIEDLPVANCSVDWVMSNCVINLSPNKPLVFEEIARVLRPGGRMLVAEILAEDLPDWVRRSDRLHDACVTGAISEAEYVNGLRDAGLTDVTVGDRYVFDMEQLVSFASGPPTTCSEATRLADALVGRIWSAYLFARKPEQPRTTAASATKKEGTP